MNARDMMVAALRDIQRDIYSHGAYHVVVGPARVMAEDDEYIAWTCKVRDEHDVDHCTPGGVLGTLYGEAHSGEPEPRIWFASFDGREDLVAFPHLAESRTLPLRDAQWRGYQSSPFMLRHPAA